MKITILSTETKHHIYFVNKLYREFKDIDVIYERRKLVKPYSTGPFFESEQDEYEELFFDLNNDGTKRHFSKELAKRVVTVHSVNQTGVDSYIKSLQPDLIIVFGTGIIYPHLLGLAKLGMINLHGGIAQAYRGLDSTLWAIYEKDFKNLGITVHYVDPELDTGEVVAQEFLTIDKNDQIYHFRYKITKTATEMILKILRKIQSSQQKHPSQIMNPKGKYYSAMTLEQKHQALKNFLEYQRGLT